MVQLTMFPSASGQVEVGDVASDKSQYVWAIQAKDANGDWRLTVDLFGPLTFLSRAKARSVARNVRAIHGNETRLVALKACIDTKGRLNRQIDGQRLK